MLIVYSIIKYIPVQLLAELYASILMYFTISKLLDGWSDRFQILYGGTDYNGECQYAAFGRFRKCYLVRYNPVKLDNVG